MSHWTTDVLLGDNVTVHTGYCCVQDNVVVHVPDCQVVVHVPDAHAARQIHFPNPQSSVETQAYHNALTALHTLIRHAPRYHCVNSDDTIASAVLFMVCTGFVSPKDKSNPIIHATMGVAIDVPL